MGLVQNCKDLLQKQANKTNTYVLALLSGVTPSTPTTQQATHDRVTAQQARGLRPKLSTRTMLPRTVAIWMDDVMHLTVNG